MTARATVVAVNEPGAALSRLSAALQDEGYDVLVAASERDVPDCLRAHHVDCVVLPFGSASHLARERAAASGIPLLHTVPVDDDALVVRTLDGGADDCAPLTADLGVLKARLRALLRRKRMDDERHAALTRAVAHKDAELVSLNYAISHDLRAPLRAIDGFGRILLEECAGHVGDEARELPPAHQFGGQGAGRTHRRPAPALTRGARRAAEEASGF